jgi:hypothetical protein
LVGIDVPEANFELGGVKPGQSKPSPRGDGLLTMPILPKPLKIKTIDGLNIWKSGLGQSKSVKLGQTDLTQSSNALTAYFPNHKHNTHLNLHSSITVEYSSAKSLAETAKLWTLNFAA